MIPAILRRLAAVPVMLFAVASLIFVIMRALPGSMVETLSSQFTSAELRDQIIARLGLNEPLWKQYLLYMNDLLRFDLGVSSLTGKPVQVMIGEALPVTVEMACAAFAVMLAMGVGMGLVAARRAGGPVDVVLRFVSVMLFSLPWFWLGLVLVLFFSLWLGWLPAFGRLPSSIDYRPLTNFIPVDALLLGRADLLGPWLSHIILPALTVGLTSSGMVMRLTRAEMLATMEKEFIRTAQMKGVGGVRVYLRHGLRNAAVGILTVLGLQFGAMLGGSVVAEVVFGYPGIGRMTVDAIAGRDYVTAQGAAVVIAALYILVNLATDLVCLWVNPRLRGRGV
jgi:peptide/nickel transport system permease protein